MKRLLSVFFSALILSPAAAYAQDDPWQAAADYSADRRGDAVLVYVDDQLVFEEYQNGYDSAETHFLASGTKSFSCALAVAAAEDGLLTFDELAADTITEWQGQPGYQDITIRQLLTLTSGLPGSQDLLQGRRVEDKAAAALEIPLTYDPDERFQYGPSHFYVFGELLRRKLDGEDVIDYLTRRIFDPIGLEGFEIGRDAAGNPNLPGGGLLTAREWADFGLLILHNGAWNGEQVLDADLLRECFIGTNANPYYGMTWWLIYDPASSDAVERLTAENLEPVPMPEGVILGETAPEVIMAAGAGKQRMYIIPSQNMVIVRFGRQDRRFNDTEFLSLLIGR
jgi:CubicO group peptidase (beta-lactamase class C family)